ncbi:MAG: SRPBCC domain-containing protein [Acidobacteriaceae bacterium]|nr:SRPBCC domain-containing protein [Acidobacteriaceae bacterium]
MKSNVEVHGSRLQITRLFEAPRQVVFSWWTQAQKLRQWSGCEAATRCDFQVDFRVGGNFTQTMEITPPSGAPCEFTVTGTYEEIVEPEKIVYRANLGPTVTRVTVEFFDHRGQTKLVLTHEGLPDESFQKNVAQGTSESLDKLEALVSAPAAVHLS